jgi:hypothetical protein
MTCVSVTVAVAVVGERVVIKGALRGQNRLLCTIVLCEFEITCDTDLTDTIEHCGK